MNCQAKKKAQKISRRAGQVTVEYILLAVTLIFLFQIATDMMRENQYLNDFSARPKAVFRSLVENGNLETDPTESQRRHPGHHSAHFSSFGKGPKN